MPTNRAGGAASKAGAREAVREHRKLARAKLSSLREKLREAMSAKKVRIKELASEARAQRKALRTQLQEKRAEVHRGLREKTRAEYQAARARYLASKARAKKECETALELARANVAAEIKHQDEQRRIARESRARHVEHVKALAHPNFDQAVRAKALLGHFGPLFETMRHTIKPAVGETRTEALLRHAETHPADMHAALEPAAERAIEQTKADILATERSIETPTEHELARAAKIARRTKETKEDASEAARAKSPKEITTAAAVAPAPPAAAASKAPNAYEAKRIARVERMRGRADKARAEAASAFSRERTLSSAIPMGQPLLVNHHSQRRHERDLRKMRALTTKGVELSKKADALDRRATFAETNRAISSDDPNAVAKLRAQLEKLNGDRERMRASNAAIRAKGDVAPALVRLGFSEAVARDLMKPDPMGRIGFPDYAFTNSSANARRLEQRIRELEAKADAPEREEIAGDVRIVEEENRVRVVFPSKPPDATRTALKGAGFRWSQTANAWQRHASRAAWYEARKIATAYAGQ